MQVETPTIPVTEPLRSTIFLSVIFALKSQVAMSVCHISFLMRMLGPHYKYTRAKTHTAYSKN